MRTIPNTIKILTDKSKCLLSRTRRSCSKLLGVGGRTVTAFAASTLLWVCQQGLAAHVPPPSICCVSPTIYPPPACLEIDPQSCVVLYGGNPRGPGLDCHDFNGNGVADACEPEFPLCVPDGATCTQVCPGPLACVPTKVRYDLKTLQVTVLECKCGPSCHVCEACDVFPPICAGDCMGSPSDACRGFTRCYPGEICDLECACGPPAEACCMGNGSCVDVDPVRCVQVYGGTAQGPGTMCLGDNNGDGIDDACCLPCGCQRYGDIATDAGGEGDCAVDLNDILCELDGFGSIASCPAADIYPCGGDGTVDLNDILAVLDAFGGSYACPHPNPPRPCCLPTGECIETSFRDCIAQKGDFQEFQVEYDPRSVGNDCAATASCGPQRCHMVQQILTDCTTPGGQCPPVEENRVHCGDACASDDECFICTPRTYQCLNAPPGDCCEVAWCGIEVDPCDGCPYLPVPGDDCGP